MPAQRKQRPYPPRPTKPSTPSSGPSETERIARIGHWNLDIASGTLNWSDEIYRIFEIDPKGFAPSYDAFLAAIHPEDRAYVDQCYRESVKQQTPYNIVHRLLMQDGRIKFVRERCETHYDAAGQPLRSVGTVQDITEQQLIFEALRNSESLLRAKFEEAERRSRKLAQAERIANIGSWEVDLAANRLDYSEEALRIHGLTRETFDGTVSGAIELAHPDDRARLRETIHATLYAGKPFDIEYRIVRPDGSERIVHAQDEVIRGADGTPLRAFGVTQDITDRMAARDALQRTVEELNEAQRLARVGSWRLDSATGQVVWTAEVYRMLGLDPSLPPPPYEEHQRLFAPESWSRLNAAMPRTLDTGTPYELELELTRADGSRGWMLARGEALRDVSGRIVGARGTAQDITQRIKGDEDLRRFRAAMDASGDAIALIDRAKLRYIDVNGSLCDLLGYTRQEILGMSPDMVFSSDLATLARDYDAIIADKDCSASRLEGHYRRKDGTLVPVETRRRALQTKDGWIIVATARDITDRKESIARIARLNRLYAVLSGINSSIVRIQDVTELYDEVCRILVESGHLALAYICVVDPVDERLRLVASSGIEAANFLSAAPRRLSLREGEPAGYAPPALAARERQPVVVNDVATDPRISRAGEHAARGIGSIAALPVCVGDQPVAVLCLHAAEAGFFDEPQMRLLNELAGDIAFALDHIEKSKRLDYLALYDQLTGLANRRLLLERLQQTLAFAGQEGNKVALLLVDLERLGTLNESLGRQAGDALVRQFAERLTHAVGASDLARVSASDFAVLFRSVKGRSEVIRRTERLWRECFATPFLVAGADYRGPARGGIALYSGAEDAEGLLQNAEAALRRAKETGERQVFHAHAMTAHSAERLSLENRLRQALERQEFIFHYQPKLNLDSGRIVGVEALMRWQSPELGLVPPLKFIPILEETGMILEAGAWALSRAVQDHKRWLDAGLPAPRVAVNVSTIQLRKKDFIARLAEILRQGDALAGIELEITESAVMEDIQGNIEVLNEARKLGVSIAIDDFGTGYSSLGYLAKLPVQSLKIDRSFITAMLNEAGTMTLVQMIISLAHSLRLKVVAEGVETQEQARTLRLLRCDEVQGYLFGKPVAFEQMSDLLARNAAGNAAGASLN